MDNFENFEKKKNLILAYQIRIIEKSYFDRKSDTFDRLRNSRFVIILALILADQRVFEKIVNCVKKKKKT